MAIGIEEEKSKHFTCNAQSTWLQSTCNWSFILIWGHNSEVNVLVQLIQTFFVSVKNSSIIEIAST